VDLGTIHLRHGIVGRALGRDIDKAVAQPLSVLRVASNRVAQYNPEGIEGLGEFVVGELRRQVANKQVAPEVARSHLPFSVMVVDWSRPGFMEKCLLPWLLATVEFCNAALQQPAIAVGTQLAFL